MRPDFTLPGYDVEGFLGAGASGESWLARDNVGGSPVVLKRVPIQGGADDRLRRLVATLRELQHPHLLPIKDLLFTGRGVFLVLAYADGGNLDQLLRTREWLDPGEVITITGPLAEAAAWLHQRGIVHGAIAATNVLFTKQGLPMLADAGLHAVVVGQGDPGPPERPAPADDVGALGGLAATALTGLALSSDPSAVSWSQQVAGLSGIPSGLVEAIESALSPRLERRPDAAGFADLVFRSGPPAPVRFPMGLVLTDTSLTDTSPVDTTPVDTTPVDTTLADTGVVGSASSTTGTEPAGADPFVERAAIASPVARRRAPGQPDADLGDLDEEPGTRRRALIGFGLGLPLLAAAAMAGGWSWQAHTDSIPATLSTPSTSPHAESTGESPQADPSHSAVETPSRPSTPRGAGRSAGTPARSPSPPPGSTAATPGATTATPGRTSATPGATAGTTAGPTEGRGSSWTREQARWVGVLRQLDARRARAFAEADPKLLDRVYLPDSPALEEDRRQVAKCVDQQCGLRGLRFAVRGLDILQAGDRRCVLRVRDQLRPYEIVYEDGRRLHRPGGAPTTRVFTLERDSGGRWRISSIHGTDTG